MGAMSFLGIGLAVGAARVRGGMVGGVTRASDGVGHRDALLFNDGATWAEFVDAGFEDIWGCPHFFNGGESCSIML